MELLLQHGAEINRQDVEHRFRTPLMVAIASPQSSTQAVEFLLSKGANPFLKDQDGKTALELASISDRSIEIVPVLKAALDKWSKKES